MDLSLYSSDSYIQLSEAERLAIVDSIVDDLVGQLGLYVDHGYQYCSTRDDTLVCPIPSKIISSVIWEYLAYYDDYNEMMAHLRFWMKRQILNYLEFQKRAADIGEIDVEEYEAVLAAYGHLEF